MSSGILAIPMKSTEPPIAEGIKEPPRDENIEIKALKSHKLISSFLLD